MASSDHTPTKRCSKCKNEYPATTEYFHRRKRAKDGLASACKPCRCKDTLRWANDNKARVQENNRKWRLANPERHAANVKRWQENNPEKVRASSDRWEENNKEYVKSYARHYYQEHKDKYRERGRAWRHANPDKAKAHDKRYREKHPEKVAAKFNRRRNALGEHTAEDILLQYKMQNGNCWWCGKPVGDDYHVDHLTPLSRGGTNNPENLVISCPFCNMSRADRLPHEWSDRLL